MNAERPERDGEAVRSVLGALVISCWCSLAIWTVVSTLAGVSEAAFAGPVRDFWRFVGFLEALDRSEPPWRHLFAAHGSHRLVFPRLLYLVEYEVFGGRNLFLVSTSLALQAALAAALSRALWLRRRRMGRVATVCGIAFVFVCAFCASQIVNFVLPWQMHHFMANSFACAGLAAWVRALDPAGSDRRAAWGAAAFAAGGIASLSAAAGMMVWPALVALSLLARSRIGALVSSAATLAAVTLYGEGAELAGAAASLPHVLAWALKALGGPLSWERPGLGSALGGAGALAGLALVAGRVRRAASSRERPGGAEAFLLGVLLFSGLGVLLVAAARAARWPDTWSMARYQTAVLLYWCSLVSLALLLSDGIGHRAARARGLVLALASVWVVWVLVPAHLRQKREFIEFGRESRRANLAIVLGVPWRASYAIVLPGFDRAKGPDAVARLRAFLMRKGYAPFHDARSRWLGRLLSDAFPAGVAGPCRGNVSASAPLAGAPGWIGASGWIARDEPRAILIEDAEGRIRGLGDTDSGPYSWRRGAGREPWFALAQVAPGHAWRALAADRSGRVCELRRG